MKNTVAVVLLLLTILFINSSLSGAYLENLPTTIVQPDGTKIECFASGDEFYNWLHDHNGFTIIVGEDGYYYYGVREGDHVVASTYRVGSVDPARSGIEPWAKISANAYRERRAWYEETIERNAVRSPHTGTINNLVIYIRFSDDSEFTIARTTYDGYFNSTTAASLKDYYNEVSYGQLNITGHHFPVCDLSTNLSYQDSEPRGHYQPYHPVTNTIGYQGGNDGYERRHRENTLVMNAVLSVRDEVISSGLNIDSDNDGYVDAVSFIVKGSHGGWNDILWAHRFQLYLFDVRISGKRVWEYTFQPETQASQVQVLCHEMFHILGAPDLYRYSDQNFYLVGPWDLMHSGFVHMGAWMKYKYAGQNWITDIPEITSPGTYTLNPLTSSTDNVFKIQSPNSDTEFFILEFRNQSGLYETNLPGSGLLIYRIDPTINGNATGPPDEVYIYRPNGTLNQVGDINTAHYGVGGRATIKCCNTNPVCFLADGSEGGLHISSISIQSGRDNYVQFEVDFLELDATPTEQYFGNIHYYTPSDPVYFYLKNFLNCCDTLRIEEGDIQLTGPNSGDFYIDVNYPIILRSWDTYHDTGSVYTEFCPLTIGSKSANIEITHTGLNSPLIIPISGIASSLEADPQECYFGAIAVNDTTDVSEFRISNPGYSCITISEGNISITGDDADNFILGDITLPVDLYNEDWFEIEIWFNPSSEGLKNAQIEITYDANNTNRESLSRDPQFTLNIPISGFGYTTSFSVTRIYTPGSIPTTFDNDPTTDSNAEEPGELGVTIPSWGFITGVDVSYDMTAIYGYMSYQRSFLRCVSEGGLSESEVYAGEGDQTGTYEYNREGLTIANRVFGGGSIDFELHAFRRIVGSGTNTYYSFVNNSTWTVTVHYVGVPEDEDDLTCTLISGPVEILWDQPADYTVSVQNIGSNTQNGYTIQLLKVGDSTVLDYLNITGPLDTAESANHTLSWTPEYGGQYDLYGRVILNDDMNSNNDDSPVLSVLVVAPLTGFPIPEDFDTTTVPYLPPGWRVENTNNDIRYWHSDPSNSHSAPYAVRCDSNMTTSTDDWFFTPPLYLSNGTVYDLSFWYRANTGVYYEHLKVHLGSSPDSNAMYPTPLFEDSSFNHTTYQQAQTTFAVTQDGVYYIGWHQCSPPYFPVIFYPGGILVDDIVIDVSASQLTPPQVTIQIIPSGRESIVFLSWDEVIGAEYYEVYSTGNPYATFPTQWELIAVTQDLFWNEPINGIRFYRVVALAMRESLLIDTIPSLIPRIREVSGIEK